MSQWKPHKPGSGCPVDYAEYVDIQTASGRLYICRLAMSLKWDEEGPEAIAFWREHEEITGE